MNAKTPGQVAYETWLLLPHTQSTTPWHKLTPYEQCEWEIIANAVRAHQFAQTLEAESDHPYRRTLLEQAFQEVQYASFRLRSCCWAILWGCARICSFWRKAWGDKGRTAKLRHVFFETWPTGRSPRTNLIRLRNTAF